MSDKEKSLLKRSLEARAVYGFLTPKPEKPSKSPSPTQEEIEAERARLEEEKKKRQKWRGIHKIMDQQRAEVEEWEREEEEAEQFRSSHRAITQRQINPFSTLYLTGADFTGKGFEAKGFVSVDDKVGDVFSIRGKANPDGSAVIKYSENEYVLTVEEVKHLLSGEEMPDRFDPEQPETVSGAHSENGRSHYLFIVMDYLKQNHVLYDTQAVDRINARENGREFSISDHIRGMVYSLLSCETPWERIEPNLKEIDKVFYDYDPDYIKSQEPALFTYEIKELKCGNRNIKRQMEALGDNVRVFERIEKEYGSLDEYINSHDPEEVILAFSDYESEYKLKMMHISLVCEYLRNVGVDLAKPDRHLCRFFCRDRMGTDSSESPATIEDVFCRIEDLVEETGLLRVEIDNIIWSFCADGYGEICTAEPHCDRCPIRDMCKYNR